MRLDVFTTTTATIIKSITFVYGHTILNIAWPGTIPSQLFSIFSTSMFSLFLSPPFFRILLWLSFLLQSHFYISFYPTFFCYNLWHEFHASLLPNTWLWWRVLTAIIWRLLEKKQKPSLVTRFKNNVFYNIYILHDTNQTAKGLE